MNMQLTLTEKQTRERDLSTLSVGQLEEHRGQVSTDLKNTFHTICTIALMAARIEAQFQKALLLETHFHKLWEELEAVGDAIHTYAALAHYSELRSEELACLVCEGMRLVEPFDRGDDICPVWLSDRDAFVAQASKLLDDDEIREETTQRRGQLYDGLVCGCCTASVG